MNSWLTRSFLSCAGGLLLATSLAKISGSIGSAGILLQPDPIFLIPNRVVYVTTGALELMVAVVCFLTRRQTLALGLVALLATNFFAYRLALWSIDWKTPCSCLGNVTDALNISPQVADNVMKVVLAYLLVGSYGLLFWKQKQWRGAAPMGTAVTAGS